MVQARPRGRDGPRTRFRWNWPVSCSSPRTNALDSVGEIPLSGTPFLAANLHLSNAASLRPGATPLLRCETWDGLPRPTRTVSLSPWIITVSRGVLGFHERSPAAAFNPKTHLRIDGWILAYSIRSLHQVPTSPSGPYIRGSRIDAEVLFRSY